MNLEKLIAEYEKTHGTGYKIKKKEKQKTTNPIFTEYLPGEVKEV